MSKIKINKTSVETRLAIERRSAAMLPDRPTQAGLKPWDIRNALFSAIIAEKGACIMGEIDRIVDEANAAIDALTEKVTTSGMVTIPVEEWSGAGPHEALVRLGDNPISNGCVVLLAPEDNATKEAAGAARMSVFPDNVIDSENSYGDFVMVLRAESGILPTIPLNFRFVVIKTDTEDKAIAAMVGVDAYGEGGGGTGSGVDENAVKKIINSMLGNVANERQYSAANPPPYPVTTVNGQSGAVNLNASDVGARPNTWTPTAEEVGADSAAAEKVQNHNEDSESHTDIRVDITTIRNMLAGVIGTDTGKSMRAVAALVVAEIVGNASDSFDTLEEIAAWIEAHPNDVAAMVKRITDLETVMGGKVSKTDIINTLDNTALDKPLSAAMGAKLNAMLSEMSDELNGKTTAEQVAAQIKAALTGYITKEDADKTYQPVGDYLTPTTGDQRYAKPTDIPTVPTKLPNPNALTINGQTYDGSSPVEVTVEGGASVDVLYIAPDGNDSNDGLTVDTPKLTVKACFMAGASRISAKRGVYRQKVDISPTGGVGDVTGRTIEIFPTDNDQTYSTDTHDRGRIVFDTSDEIAVTDFTAYNAIKSAPYAVSNYTFTRIFTNGSTDERASVWLVSADELTVCHKLTPVTTLAEVESTADTFYWSAGTLYINADWTGVEKVYVSNEMYNQMQFKGLASVVLREVEARLSQGYCVNIENVPHFELFECAAKFTGVTSTGLHPKNASGKMVRCYAAWCYDGLSPSGYGHTEYIDCVAEYNRDDGVSHHDACTGTIIGGRYDHNGKYGVAPAYGARVDIYNAVCRYNGLTGTGDRGGIGYLYTTNKVPASGIVQGCVLEGNKIGLVVNANCSVVAANCHFVDNETDKSINASAVYTEYKPKTETWTFTLDDGTTLTKAVMIGD